MGTGCGSLDAMLRELVEGYQQVEAGEEQECEQQQGRTLDLPNTPISVNASEESSSDETPLVRRCEVGAACTCPEL